MKNSTFSALALNGLRLAQRAVVIPSIVIVALWSMAGVAQATTYNGGRAA